MGAVRLANCGGRQDIPDEAWNNKRRRRLIDMKKMSFEDFKKVMRSYQKEKKYVEGVIVFTEDSFDKPYDEQARSYKVCSMAKYFNPFACGNGLVGDCLDGTDDGVRLDYFMGVYGWKPEYCYIV